MSWITLPLDRLIRTLVMILLGAGLTGAWAQEQANPDAGSSVAAEAPADADADAGTTESPKQAERPSAPAAEPSNENSPFDYQASEEISQDRSVSFPVDI